MGMISTLNKPLPPKYIGEENIKTMTIREYFVAQAMSGMLSNGNMVDDKKDSAVVWLVEGAVRYADACLAREAETREAREKSAGIENTSCLTCRNFKIKSICCPCKWEPKP